MKFKKITPKIMGFLSFLTPLLVFSLTCSRTITGYGDSAEFATDAYLFQAAHPSGFPIFIILGKLFTLIPLGSIAFRVNLLSCVLGAFSIFFLYKIFYKLGLSAVSSFLASQLLAFSYLFWEFATNSEIFMLNSFFFIFLIFLLILSLQKKSEKTLYLFSFIFGLAFTNHLVIALLAPAAAYLIYVGHPKLEFKKLPILALFFIAGLSPYLLVAYSSYHTVYPFFGNIPGISRFLQYISRSDYGGLISAGAGSGSTSGTWGLYGHFLVVSMLSFTPIILIAALYFIKRTFSEKNLIFNFLTIVFAITFLIFPAIYLKGYDPTDLHILAVSEKFYLMGVITLLIIGVMGLKFIKFLGKERAFRAVLVILVGFMFITNYPKLNRRNDTLAKNYAINILNQIEPNSIVFTSDDLTMFSLFYFSQTEKIKPDIRIVNSGFLSNSSYQKELKKTWPDLYQTDSEYIYDILRDIVHQNQDKNPVYFVMVDDPYPLGFSDNPYIFIPQGLVLKADESATYEKALTTDQSSYWDNYNLEGLDDTYNDPTSELIKLNYSFRRQVNAKVFLMAHGRKEAKNELIEAEKMDPGNNDIKMALNNINLPQPPKNKLTVQDYLDSAKTFIKASPGLFDINYYKAVYDLQQAEKLDPKNEEIHYSLAELYEYFGCYRLSRNEYLSAYEINPTDEWKQKAEIVGKAID